MKDKIERQRGWEKEAGQLRTIERCKNKAARYNSYRTFNYTFITINLY